MPSKEGQQLTHDVYHIIHGWSIDRIFIPATKMAYIKRFMSVTKLKAKVYDLKEKQILHFKDKSNMIKYSN